MVVMTGERGEESHNGSSSNNKSEMYRVKPSKLRVCSSNSNSNPDSLDLCVCSKERGEEMGEPRVLVVVTKPPSSSDRSLSFRAG